MKHFRYTVQNPAGLHARPASQLIIKARSYQSEIRIGKNDKHANPKSMMSLLALNVNQNDLIDVTVVGEDEEAAAAGLEAFMNEYL